VWTSTNLRPKPAGGGGPPALNWKIPRMMAADVVALADLATGRVWAIAWKELAIIPQQHSTRHHQMIMVIEEGWTSPPHPRIRHDQFEHLLLERRVDELFGG